MPSILPDHDRAGRGPFELLRRQDVRLRLLVHVRVKGPKDPVVVMVVANVKPVQILIWRLGEAIHFLHGQAHPEFEVIPTRRLAVPPLVAAGVMAGAESDVWGG